MRLRKRNNRQRLVPRDSEDGLKEPKYLMRKEIADLLKYTGPIVRKIPIHRHGILIR